MEQVPSQDQAHLVVAAVRVLSHKLGRPASIDEIATLLELSKELTGHQVRALESVGIARTIKSPFDVRVEIRDHLKIEELPRKDSGPGLEAEVEAFHQRFQKKQEDLANLFESGDTEQKRKERLAGLDKELEDFKSPRRRNPFDDDPGTQSGSTPG